MSLVVTRAWREAADVHSLELADLEGRQLPPFTAGAHVDIEIAPGLVRQYSLCNDPRGRDHYQIAVLREDAGRGGSVALIDMAQAGRTLKVSEPRNHFALEPSARRTVLIAGGIGVTPILCMAERLAHTGEPFELHYAARSPERAPFLARIGGSAFAGRARVYFSEGPDRSRIDLEALLADPVPGAHLYVCGPARLIEAALAIAKARGWPSSRVHREFFAPPGGEAQAETGAFEIEIASSGQVLPVPADRSITQVLAEHGVEIATSCEQGVCGTCVTRVLEGEPDHRDYFLTVEEQAAGDQITPCCSRAKTGRLVLDL
ncbi:MAG TPA: PDR/VanB family oxidoreductase [Caulobacteraceae bacterium]